MRAVSSDNPTARADAVLQSFVVAMAAAGNPGAGKHEVGVHKVEGWIIAYDPMIGGAHVQAVIGLDCAIHARRAERSLRVHRMSASEWVAREPDATDPAAAIADFADQLAEILAFNGVAGDGLASA